jgi:hypothetical protein
MYAIDPHRSFTAAVLMGSGPRMKFGTLDQDVTTTGEKRWFVEVAVTMPPASPGQRSQSEVITVGISGPPTDPAEGILPGAVVELDNLKVGIMQPERGEGDRIRGGRPYFTASGVRAVNGRPPKDQGVTVRT